MKKNVRLATTEDIDTLVTLRFDYFKAERWELTPGQKDIIGTNLLSYYKRHLNLDFFASFIEEDGKLASVAFLAVAEKPANISYPTGQAGTILNVFTYQQYRNKGYAHDAVLALVEEAKRQGLTYLEFPTAELGDLLYKKLRFARNIVDEYTVMKLAVS